MGDDGVGKNSLAMEMTRTYACGEFDPTGSDVEGPFRKQLVVDNRMTFLEIFDIAGQDGHNTGSRFRDQLVRECNGIALVYSINSRATFDSLEKWHQTAQQLKAGATISMVVGNKFDKATDEREVSREEGRALARQLGCGFIETSAKTAENVERMFSDIIRALVQASAPDTGPIQSNNGKVKKGMWTKCIIM